MIGLEALLFIPKSLLRRSWPNYDNIAQTTALISFCIKANNGSSLQGITFHKIKLFLHFDISLSGQSITAPAVLNIGLINHGTNNFLLPYSLTHISAAEYFFSTARLKYSQL